MNESGVFSRLASLAHSMAGPPKPWNQTRDLQDIRKVNVALLPLLAVAVVAVVSVGSNASSIGPILIWAVACLAVGALTGFLFGIPRAGIGTRSRSADGAGTANMDSTPIATRNGGGPNTNLEEVSDWLTKILVGLTLVNLNEVQKSVQAIARNAASALSANPTDTEISISTALIVAFAVLGFIGSYLYTRLFLQGAIRRSDEDLEHFNAVVIDELSRTQAIIAPQPVVGEPSVPSPTDRTSAERLARALPADRPDAALAPFRALASEYVRLREEMEFGGERTRRMTAIVARMRPFALAAAPYLSQLASSSSEGERLAAVVVIQMKFDPAWIDWLADRLWQEAAFIGYQSASTLLARLPAASSQEVAKIRLSVDAVRSRIPYSEEQRDKLIQRILA